MDWDLGAAVLAGLAATGVMTVLLYMGRAMMPEKMPMNILHMEGTMVTRNTGQAYMAGLMMHAMMGGSYSPSSTPCSFRHSTSIVTWWCGASCSEPLTG